jgi:hypothetical protein
MLGDERITMVQELIGLSLSVAVSYVLVFLLGSVL